MTVVCVCGHVKDSHWLGVYNCGDCLEDDACVIYRPMELAAVPDPDDVPANRGGNRMDTWGDVG